ncbi:disulfide bond formation protein B [uncultured Ferrovibrio sp.]|jgi:disulfide bond formation protein DsbB|uniref:disulfide bond formation protein B n=1 Tax=uncultured Ferrovibrio sp. TaxID=1576913 RepID=UPI00260AFC18|nr:disulfide bond formation protein B [uncultured Ferrovibrio sp.]
MSVAFAFHPRHSGLLVAAASVASLAFAFIAQYGFGLAPCELCIWQRWPYTASILLGLAALLMPRWRGPLLVLAALSFATGASIAIFHVGVEEKWWQGLASCGGAPTPKTLEELRAQLMTAPVVRCDEAAFRFLGLSMAGWNVIWAGLLAVFTAIAARRAFRENT